MLCFMLGWGLFGGTFLDAMGGGGRMLSFVFLSLEFFISSYTDAKPTKNISDLFFISVNTLCGKIAGNFYLMKG